MTSLQDTVADLLCLAGGIAVVYGLWSIWPPLAPLAGGAVAIAAGVLLVRRKPK